MLKKSIAFEDFNGTSCTEDFYFNLTKADLVKMEIVEKDGLESMIEDIVKADDRKKMLEVMDRFIATSYGIKSADGKKFERSEAISNDFMNSNAYSELFVEFCTHTDKLIEFMLGVIPAELRGSINEIDIKKQVHDISLPDTDAASLVGTTETGTSSSGNISQPLPQPALDLPQDITKLSREELIEAFKRKNQE